MGSQDFLVKVKMAPNSSVRYLICFFLINYISAVELDSDSPSVIQLTHSFGSTKESEPRGQINVRSLRSGSLSVQQDSVFDLDSLQHAATANELYHLEATVKTNNVERTFLTSTKAVNRNHNDCHIFFFTWQCCLLYIGSVCCMNQGFLISLPFMLIYWGIFMEYHYLHHSISAQERSKKMSPVLTQPC